MNRKINIIGHMLIKGKFIRIGGDWANYYFIGPFRTKKIAEKTLRAGKKLESPDLLK